MFASLNEKKRKRKKLKTILGLHDGHNAAAALLEKGRIVAAVQEERLHGTKIRAAYRVRPLAMCSR